VRPELHGHTALESVFDACCYLSLFAGPEGSAVRDDASAPFFLDFALLALGLDCLPAEVAAEEFTF